MDVPRADNCQKLTNFPISSPKPDLHNINAHTKFSENSLKFTEAIIRKQKYWQMDIQQTDGGMDRPKDTIIPCHICVAGYKDA